MKKQENNDNLFNKLAAAEDAFFSSQFFSPVLRGKPVRLKIAGVVVNLTVSKPKNFEGWGVFRPLNYKEATFVRAPNMREKQEYYKLFPLLRLILCRRDTKWYGIPASLSDTRFTIVGLAPIELAEEVQMFDTIKVRFDGANLWYEQLDERANPRTAIYLRECLNKLVEPDKLEFPGLTAEERNAYAVAYVPALQADMEAKRNKDEEKIKAALERAGAKYASYVERKDTFTVEYTVDGEQHRTVVKKNNLAVESAGICLSGGDTNFDLQSLVGVIREGRRRRLIVRVGLNREYGDTDYYNPEDDDYD